LQLRLHCLEGSANDAIAIRMALRRRRAALSAGLLLNGPDVEFIVSACEPIIGWDEEGVTEVILGDETLRVFKKVHVLPYRHECDHDWRLLFHEYVAPFFERRRSAPCREGSSSHTMVFNLRLWPSSPKASMAWSDVRRRFFAKDGRWSAWSLMT